MNLGTTAWVLFAAGVTVGGAGAALHYAPSLGAVLMAIGAWAVLAAAGTSIAHYVQRETADYHDRHAATHREPAIGVRQ